MRARIRTTSRLPRPVVEIKPHPHGMQFGTLQRMLKDTKERNANPSCERV